MSPLMRFVLSDGESIIASCEHLEAGYAALRRGSDLITLVGEDGTAEIPVRKIEALLPLEPQVPLPNTASLYCFALHG